MNLLRETLVILEQSGKTESDIMWIGSRTHKISWEDFKKVAETANYDWGFGSQKVACDLIIVGKDWWMSREEYDGQEWWRFHTLPIEPTEVITELKALTTDQAEDLGIDVSCGWEDLIALNGLREVEED